MVAPIALKLGCGFLSLPQMAIKIRYIRVKYSAGEWAGRNCSVAISKHSILCEEHKQMLYLVQELSDC